MSIYIENEINFPLSFDYETLIQRVVDYALDAVKCLYEVELNVILTDDNGIQEINQQYRQMNAPTDVLSFPMIHYKSPGDFSEVETIEDSFNPETGELLLGDIVISVERMLHQAVEYGHSEERELAFLMVHSMLHLCGFDHMEEEDRLVMEEKQREILGDLGITR